MELVTIQEAAKVVDKSVHNIRDYIQRKRISKYNHKGEVIEKASNGELRVDLTELRAFLQLVEDGEQHHHHAGLQTELGFYGLPEHQRTKHVHRLHPYLGKFIPQLVEWFLSKYFTADDLILDPFMGSGTTLIQANEMRMNSIGIDISEFCCRIGKVKTQKYDVVKVRGEILQAEKRVQRFSTRLIEHMSGSSGSQQLPLFRDEDFETFHKELIEECKSDYLKTWFAPRALAEILYYQRLVEKGDFEYKDLLRVLLSRSVRSARLVAHYDLATPKAPLPVGIEYWCRKHRRMCLPIDNCITKIHAYSEDTARRIQDFNELRSDKEITVIHGDSRTIDLLPYLGERKINGIFTSPPYVGQIDYHDQHIYAYELFDIERNDYLEIGPKTQGKSRKAQQEYIEGIAQVFKNAATFLTDEAKIFVVANDRFNLYPQIAERAALIIVEEFKRAVTKRTEQGNDPYEETIFWMRKA